MRWVLPLSACVLPAMVAFAVASPVEGPSWSRKEVPAGTNGGAEPGALEYKKLYVAGQRACVIAIGDHKPVVDLEIKVYDSKGLLVAQARGKEPARDFVAVFWYPPREESYRIVISSYGTEYNKCSLAFK
jgi:hypothetical protein